MKRLAQTAYVLVLCCASGIAFGQQSDPERDILVTFDNDGARALSSSFAAPYRNRKRYSISADARRHADAVAAEYALTEVDHWPIRSLSVYCFVYRIPAGQDRDSVIRRLRSDERIESAQALQEFETGTEDTYNDTYVGFQHGLETMGIQAAHRYSQGDGVRVAIVDSRAENDHEDLRGRVTRQKDFTPQDQARNETHGTAVASIIGASANNGKGIVGVAPRAQLELYVSCWADPGGDKAICDSFTLAKSLDTVLEDPPDVLNLSLAGPTDPLVGRLLTALHHANTIIVAASLPGAGEENGFPASHSGVIGVSTSGGDPAEDPARDGTTLLAPGHHIMVALPDDNYDFRSGSSLAAAHVSGVVALLRSASPDLSFQSALSYLQRSQASALVEAESINACVALQLADPENACIDALVSSQN